MASIEDRLRPKVTARPWRRDVLAIAMLALLAAAVLPAWLGRQGLSLGQVGGEEQPDHTAGLAQYLENIPGQIASFRLLLATGFALVLRCGGIDLSVWSVAGVGGLAAAVMMNRGVGLFPSLALAGCVGLAIGALNGLAVTRLRLPSVGVTLAAAIVLTLAMLAATGSQPLAAPHGSMEVLRNWLPFPPLLVGRMLIVAAVWSAVMLVLAGADAIPPNVARPDRGRELMLALAVSGALSAIGGACWLIDSGEAPVSSWPIGDLRVPAAALLAGAAFFGGRGRTMLACLLLPPAMLVATAWRQEVILQSYHGITVQSLMLICMTIVAQAAMGNAARQRAGVWLAVAALAMIVSGTVLVGASGGPAGVDGRMTLHLTGMAAWLTGTVLLLVSRRRLKPTAALNRPST